MQEYNASVLHAGAHLSTISQRLVDLLGQFIKQVSRQYSATTADQSAETMRTHLARALELQKDAVEEHLVLVRSMLGTKRLRRQSRVTELIDASPKRRRRSRTLSEGTVDSYDAECSGNDQFSQLGFTRRELEIVQLVASGHDNRQIGESLGIAQQTVKNHLHSIFGKAGISSRRDLILRAQAAQEEPAKALAAGALLH